MKRRVTYGILNIPSLVEMFHRDDMIAVHSSSSPTPANRWPVPLAWGVIVLSAIHMLLLYLLSPALLLPLQSLAALGAGAVQLHIAAGHAPGSSDRHAWLFVAAAVCCEVSGNIIRMVVVPATSPMSSLETMPTTTRVGSLLSYLLLVVGLALALPPHRGRAASGAVRLMLDSMAMGSMVMVLLVGVVPPLARETLLAFFFFSLDAGLFYAVVMLRVRYREHGGPLLLMVCLSVLCMLSTSFLRVGAIVMHAPFPWDSLTAPAATLRHAVLAFGAAWSVHTPPLPPDGVEPMTTSEWVLWSILPHVLILALTGVVMSGVLLVPTSWIAAFVTCAILRQIWVQREHRATEIALARAERIARQQQQETDEFIARVVHDLGAPAQGIKSALRLPDPPFALVRDQVRVIEEFLDQSRTYLRARRVPLTMQPVNLTPLVLMAVDALQSTAVERGVTLRVVLDAVQPVVMGDEQAIRRVLTNLLLNAIRFSPQNEAVVVRVSGDTRTIHLTVQDRGQGIPRHAHRQVFQPHVTTACCTDGELHVGMGLGLAIVKELTHALGGHCGVVSEQGQGSIFWVRMTRAHHKPCEG